MRTDKYKKEYSEFRKQHNKSKLRYKKRKEELKYNNKY